MLKYGMLIPPEELYASNVQHPDQRTWHWQLHTRRIPVQGSESGVADDRHAIAGVGDASGLVWT